MEFETLEERFQMAADIIRRADALLIGAGAGMGVDSGLPDFRGPEGFWKAYPPFRGRKFSDMSTPHWFQSDPGLAWGFFGHRFNLYREAVPHAGFAILKRWGEQLPKKMFVFTSNVDGQFQKAGFSPDHILECHGSIHYQQCAEPCTRSIWSAKELRYEVDPATIRTSSDFPICPQCRSIARPNILMFNDWNWVPDRAEMQSERYREWLQHAESHRLAIIEIGAGLAVPSVRMEMESRQGSLIRINPRESDVEGKGVGLPMGGVMALQKIDALL